MLWLSCEVHTPGELQADLVTLSIMVILGRSGSGNRLYLLIGRVMVSISARTGRKFQSWAMQRAKMMSFGAGYFPIKAYIPSHLVAVWSVGSTLIGLRSRLPTALRPIGIAEPTLTPVIRTVCKFATN